MINEFNLFVVISNNILKCLTIVPVHSVGILWNIYRDIEYIQYLYGINIESTHTNVSIANLVEVWEVNSW